MLILCLKMSVLATRNYEQEARDEDRRFQVRISVQLLSRPSDSFDPMNHNHAGHHLAPESQTHVSPSVRDAQ